MYYTCALSGLGLLDVEIIKDLSRLTVTYPNVSQACTFVSTWSSASLLNCISFQSPLLNFRLATLYCSSFTELSLSPDVGLPLDCNSPQTWAIFSL